jgi:NAD(P)-dependent dehydrogenase (short-subunit alcohol dehydrogenase family)
MSGEGTRVLITGVGAGIGRAAAEVLTQRGCRVAGTVRRAPSGRPSAYHSIHMDLTDPDGIRRGLEEALAFLGGLDVLINNAGVSHVGPFEHEPVDHGRWIMETNFFGPAELIRAALPTFREQGRGLIVNVSSLAGLMGVPYQSYYAASKFALEGLSESLRLELRPLGVRVALIEPTNIQKENHNNRPAAGRVKECYQRDYDCVLEVVNRTVAEARPPEVVAEKIYEIVEQNGKRLRYTAGRNAGLIALLRRLLPERVVESRLLKYYGLG